MGGRKSMPKKKRIIICDGTNQFIRNYTVVPTLDKNGQRNGGVYGMLRSLAGYCRDMKPDKVIVCWDGAGGSKKRRAIFKDYKAGRKPIRPPRINSNYEFEEENIADGKKRQRYRLAKYMHHLPLIEITLTDLEADDVVGYLVNLFPDDEKIIISSDKDFFQLLNKNTIVYRPVKKQVYTTRNLIEEFDIYPHNFALARAITGDKSDNIIGVHRVGLKTLLKDFPFMSGKEQFELDDIFDFAREKRKEKKGEKYVKFLDVEQRLRDNYKVVQLYTPTISYSNIDLIIEATKGSPRFNATEIRKLLFEDSITTLSAPFFQQFRVLNSKGK